MLEDAAFSFVVRTDIHVGVIFGILILGFIAALIAPSSSRWGLHRAPYFALSMLLMLASSIVNFAWLLGVDAMIADRLWVLVGLIFACVAAIGYGYGVIALARSRAAFGHGRYAFLAPIPIACLYLFLVNSKSAADDPPRSSGKSVALVLLGFLVAGLSFALLNVFEKQAASLVASAENDLRAQRASIQHLVRRDGIESTLNSLAAGADLPITIDEATKLASLDASGVRLRRTYIVSRSDFVVDEVLRALVTNFICTYPPFIPLLEAGAEIEEVFTNGTGSVFGNHLVTAESCGTSEAST